MLDMSVYWTREFQLTNQQMREGVLVLGFAGGQEALQERCGQLAPGLAALPGALPRLPAQGRPQDLHQRVPALQGHVDARPAPLVHRARHLRKLLRPHRRTVLRADVTPCIHLYASASRC